MVSIAGYVVKLAGFLRPFAEYRMSGRVRPVLAGYKLTHRCNLKCNHCPYWRRSGTEQDFSGVLATLQRLRKMGVRILILEGGEPLLWTDGAKTIADVVNAARNLFESVCLTTNGTLSWAGLGFDRVWVSLDGPARIHDSIRGAGAYDKVLDNVRAFGRGKVFVSTTISSVNYHAIPEMVSQLRGEVAGITIQFYYPYDGLPDELYIPYQQRGELLDELITLKRQGYPVANSVRSLQDVKRENWTCEDRLLANAEPDGSVFHGCYLKNRAASHCSLCGFTAHNEMSLAFAGHWESICAGMRIFFSD